MNTNSVMTSICVSEISDVDGNVPSLDEKPALTKTTCSRPSSSHNVCTTFRQKFENEQSVDLDPGHGNQQQKQCVEREFLETTEKSEAEYPNHSLKYVHASTKSNSDYEQCLGPSHSGLSCQVQQHYELLTSITSDVADKLVSRNRVKLKNKLIK